MSHPPSNMDTEQAECIAGHWIDAVGVDVVAAAGVTPDAIAAGTSSVSDVPVDRPTAEKIVDSYGTCEFDIVELTVSGFEGAVGGDPTKQACIEGVVTPELARRYLIAALVAEEDGTEIAEIQKIVEPCLA